LDIVRSEIIEPLLQLAVDPIPNIRFNVAKSLEVVAITYGTMPEGHEIVQQRIVPALEQQRNDQDADVRYFASRALHRALSVAEVTGKSESLTGTYSSRLMFPPAATG
jgi:serine/threonine-protein phosphatase 2A regulatory subunit A